MSDVTLIPIDPSADDVQYLEDRIYEFNSVASNKVIHWAALRNRVHGG